MSVQNEISRKQYLLGLEDHERLKDEVGGGPLWGSIVIVEEEYLAGKRAMSERFAYQAQGGGLRNYATLD